MPHISGVVISVSSCDCERGYTGERCEDPVNPCERNLCLNGGVCVSEGSGFRCECPEGYVVPICEKVEDCNRRSCNDKGECKVSQYLPQWPQYYILSRALARECRRPSATATWDTRDSSARL